MATSRFYSAYTRLQAQSKGRSIQPAIVSVFRQQSDIGLFTAVGSRSFSAQSGKPVSGVLGPWKPFLYLRSIEAWAMRHLLVLLVCNVAALTHLYCMCTARGLCAWQVGVEHADMTALFKLLAGQDSKSGLSDAEEPLPDPPGAFSSMVAMGSGGKPRNTSAVHSIGLVLGKASLWIVCGTPCG